MFTHTLKTHGKKDIDLFRNRLQKVRLTWPQQILDILMEFNVKSINDLGCNYFQLYKEIKLRKKNYNYFGYDIEKEFVKIGLKKFPELKSKHKICNIENSRLRISDCSIISAMLEHSDNPNKILNNLIKSTKKIIIIRGYFGLNDKKSLQTKNVMRPCNHNQFSFNRISNFFKKKKFSVNFILDKATNFSNSYKLINNNKKIKRNIYICLATKK